MRVIQNVLTNYMYLVSKLNDSTICFIYTFWFDKFSLSLPAFIRYNAKLFNTFYFDEFSNAINLYTLGLT